jgi:methylglutaconyl-CoA hydratase
MKTIRTERRGGILRILLNRPDVRNAFDETMIAELTAAFREAAESSEDLRAVLLAGEGPVFCAGADINWMRRAAEFTHEENRRDALRLAEMVEALDRIPRPTVARVQKAAFGGALGLLAACDVVVASEDAVFAFSEVRLGIAPAVIAPYVIRRIGAGATRWLLLTGERFDAATAQRIGLVHHVAPPARLDEAVEQVLSALLAGGPRAQAACKELVRQLAARPGEDHQEMTAALIAGLRVGPEGQEGLRAFLEKRPPSWKAD